VTTDEIYQRYLDKAIKEILRLEHEVAEAAAGNPVAQPTGNPLGTIFLVKYGPQAQELQEGVAFHGRAGHALKRSLERLKVDPRESSARTAIKFVEPTRRLPGW
jgi:uracil-DNA glycosylase